MTPQNGDPGRQIDDRPAGGGRVTRNLLAVGSATFGYALAYAFLASTLGTGIAPLVTPAIVLVAL